MVQRLEVYAIDSNYAVVKPPGRKYPSCVIHGDSLCILCRLAVNVAVRVRARAPVDDEFLGELQDLVESLVGRLLHYQRVFEAHRIELPYTQPVTEADIIRLLPELPEEE